MMRHGLVGVCTSSEVFRVGIEAVVSDVDSINGVLVGTNITTILAHGPAPGVVIIEGRSHQNQLAEFLEVQSAAQSEFLLITTTSRAGDVAYFLRHGVRGMLTSDCTSADLKLAVQAVARRNCYIQRKLCDLLAGALVVPRRLPIQLTARESEVFELVCEGLSNHDIAQRIHVSHRTVKYHVSNLLGKLGAHSRAQAIAIAIGRN